MADKKVTFAITEVTVTTGKSSSLEVLIDDKRVKIPVPTEVKAYFDAQFSRPNPTTLQKKKYATVMSLMRAAYLAGKAAR